MASKPVSLTTVASDPSDYAPEPLVLVVPGYDAGETQTLKSVSGVLTWVTDTP